MAIEGAMQIQGGNWQIFDGMVKASNATLVLNSTVSDISKSKGKYTVKTTSPDLVSEELFTNEEPFDTIVLAAPLQFTNITIEKDLLKRIPDAIPYVTLHVTLFTSKHTLSPSFFGLAADAEVPNVILTTLPPDETLPNPEDGAGSPGFFSISTLRTVINPATLEREHLYKIFSPKKLDSDFLSSLLGASVPSDLTDIHSYGEEAITWYYPHVWKSYPYEYPRVTFEDPELARGFYYTSGIESFISTMETSALMGMNVAQLIIDDYTQLLEDQGASSEGQKILHLEEL